MNDRKYLKTVERRLRRLDLVEKVHKTIEMAGGIKDSAVAKTEQELYDTMFHLETAYELAATITFWLAYWEYWNAFIRPVRRGRTKAVMA